MRWVVHLVILEKFLNDTLQAVTRKDPVRLFAWESRGAWLRRGLLWRKHSVLRKERIHLCEWIWHPVSQTSGRCGRILLSVQRTGSGLSWRNHRWVRSAEGIFCLWWRSGGGCRIRSRVSGERESEVSGIAGLNENGYPQNLNRNCGYLNALSGYLCTWPFLNGRRIIVDFFLRITYNVIGFRTGRCAERIYAERGGFRSIISARPSSSCEACPCCSLSNDRGLLPRIFPCWSVSGIRHNRRLRNNTRSSWEHLLRPNIHSTSCLRWPYQDEIHH